MKPTPDDENKHSIYVQTHLFVFDGFIDRIIQIFNEEREAKNLLFLKNRKLEAVPDEETALLFNDKIHNGKTGCNEYLRTDFRKSGEEFWTTQLNYQPELNIQPFINDLDKVIKTLRKITC